MLLQITITKSVVVNMEVPDDTNKKDLPVEIVEKAIELAENEKDYFLSQVTDCEEADSFRGQEYYSTITGDTHR